MIRFTLFWYVFCCYICKQQWAIALYSKNELIITGYHIDREGINSIAPTWHVPAHISKMIKPRASCGVLYTGTLRVPISDAKTWLHGSGSLIIQSPNRSRLEISCIYMTNVGVFPGNPRVCSMQNLCGVMMRLFNVCRIHRTL